MTKMYPVHVNCRKVPVYIDRLVLVMCQELKYFFFCDKDLMKEGDRIK